MQERLPAILAAARGADLLDIGCVDHTTAGAAAPSWLHARLSQAFPRVVGLDILEEETAALRARGFDVRCGNAEDFDLGETFDTIVAGDVIEHLSNPGRMLDGCRAHLRPGGRLVLTTPNVFSIVYFLGNALRRRHPWNREHTLWLDEHLARQLLERHNFRVLDVQFVGTFETTDREGARPRGPRPSRPSAILRLGYRVLRQPLLWLLPDRLHARTLLLVAEPAG